MKISIITITYNSEKTLEDTIQSVARQNYPDLEYIIVDGGSKDATLDIVKKYSNVVTKWISEPDKGISDAFNKGIKIASGELIGIINSDDMLTDNSLNIIEKNIKPEADVIYGNAIMFGGRETNYRCKPADSLEVMRKRMAVVHPATFVKKSAYDKYGTFDLKYKCQMDRDLLLRMYVAGAKFQYLNEDLAMMRLGGVNQRTYVKQTVPEGIEISIKNGMNPVQAYMLGMKSIARFRVANFIRKLPGSESIRKKLHAKTTDLDV